MENNNLYNNFYSRQIGTYGLETQIKINQMKVFIYGMRGVGIETAKNLVLAGPESVTIFDPNISKMNDLTSNYFLKEEDVINNKRRDEASISHLSELNPYVNLNIMIGNDIILDIEQKLKDIKLKYNLVVITEFLPKKLLEEIDELCRKENIGFILSLEFGIYGLIFVDFGNNFTIYDETGDDTKEYLIEYITKEKKGKVFINSSLSGDIELNSNDLVSFKEIEGMVELNNCSPKKIKINENIIEIDDTSNFSDYIQGGSIFNVKIKKSLKFESFKERVEEPFKEGEEYNDTLDFLNPNIQEILGIGLLSLFQFYEENKHLPNINESEDATKLFQIAKSILIKKENEGTFWVKNIRNDIEVYDIDFNRIFENTIRHLSNWAKVEICPISSFLGGVTAQEIIKYSGKYKPIHQWLYCDFSQIVENLNINEDDRKMTNSRYDDQIAIFGKEIQKKLEDTNIFMIGAGALGCEFMKTFSAMGIATKANKNLIVTDNDYIEISNLNRQFLFNKDSIGKSKAEVACESIKKLNKDFNCISFKKRLNKETENFFDEIFWKKQDYIINAVDNSEARIYTANQSLIYKKILIDSGTLGTKANSQIIIPHKTIPYSPREKKENKIHFCTLASHPFNINHCIEWARDNFDKYFVNNLKEVKEFLNDREQYYESKLKKEAPSEQFEKLKEIFEYSKIAIEKNYEKCIEKGFKQYNTNFHNNILDLIKRHEKEAEEFWASDKRFPHVIKYNNQDEYSFLFIKKYAQILARSLDVPIINDDEEIKKIISGIKIEKYIPKSIGNSKQYNIEAKLTKKEWQIKKKQITEKINNYKKEINIYFDSIEQKVNSDMIKIEEFDKDNDTHIEFLYAFTNLRAENYNIEKCDISKVKMISGKIVPAIASTTSAIVGIVALQLYVLKETEDIKYLRNCYFDFATNIICFENVRKCKYITEDNYKLKEDEKKYKLIPDKFTIWDYFIINESLSIKQFIEYMKKKYNIEITSIFSGEINLYLKNISKDGIWNKKIEDIYNELSEIKLFENKKYLMLEISGEFNDYLVKSPSIKYNFKK